MWFGLCPPPSSDTALRQLSYGCFHVCLVVLYPFCSVAIACQVDIVPAPDLAHHPGHAAPAEGGYKEPLPPAEGGDAEPLPPPAELVAPDEPPPLPPPVHAERAPREAQAIRWPAASASSPWTIAKIRRDGVHTGWGATCGLHFNEHEVRAGQRLTCKKTLQFCGMSDEECRLRIIGWLIEGLGIDDTDADGRTLHLQVGPRDLPLLSEVDLERTGVARFP